MGYASADPALVFSWSVSEPAAAVLNSFSDADAAPDVCCVTFNALQSGVTTVTVTVDVAELRNVSHLQQIVGNRRLQASATIEVVTDLHVTSPESLDTPNSVVVTPAASLELDTNRDSDANITYSVYGDAGLLNVTSRGVLTAADAVGAAVVSVTARETSGGLSQSSVLSVTVAEARYGLLAAEAGVAVGAAVVARSRWHAASGRPLTAAAGRPLISLNRRDLLSVASGPGEAFTLRATAGGLTILALTYAPAPSSLPRPAPIPHYIPLVSGSALLPSGADCLVEGAALQWRALGRGGVWGASDPAVLAVNPHSGVSVALSPGRAAVTLAAQDSVLHLPAAVTVLPPTALSLSAPASTISPHSPAPFLLPISLTSAHCPAFPRNIEGFEPNTDCHEEGEEGCSPPLHPHPLLSRLQCSLTLTSRGTTLPQDVFSAEPLVSRRGLLACGLRASAGTGLSGLYRSHGNLTLTVTASFGELSGAVALTALPAVAASPHPDGGVLLAGPPPSLASLVVSREAPAGVRVSKRWAAGGVRVEVVAEPQLAGLAELPLLVALTGQLIPVPVTRVEDPLEAPGAALPPWVPYGSTFLLAALLGVLCVPVYVRLTAPASPPPAPAAAPATPAPSPAPSPRSPPRQTWSGHSTVYGTPDLPPSLSRSRPDLLRRNL